MYSRQNGLPLHKLLGVISKTILLIYCDPSPPTHHSIFTKTVTTNTKKSLMSAISINSVLNIVP